MTLITAQYHPRWLPLFAATTFGAALVATFAAPSHAAVRAAPTGVARSTPSSHQIDLGGRTLAPGWHRLNSPDRNVKVFVYLGPRERSAASAFEHRGAERGSDSSIARTTSGLSNAPASRAGSSLVYQYEEWQICDALGCAVWRQKVDGVWEYNGSQALANWVDCPGAGSGSVVYTKTWCGVWNNGGTAYPYYMDYGANWNVQMKNPLGLEVSYWMRIDNYPSGAHRLRWGTF